jgi:hypothetical protein
MRNSINPGVLAYFFHISSAERAPDGVYHLLGSKGIPEI